MKKTMNKKSAGSISIISGSDGPTSVFIVGRQHIKMTMKQRIDKMLFQLRKKYAAKTIKANPHSMEQVAEYAKTKWGYTEMSPDTRSYQTEYKQLRASFLLQYQPQLLGDLAEVPKLQSHSEEAINIFLEQHQKREKAAEEISAELFDIDLCILHKEASSLFSRILLESNYNYIGGSASGNKREMKKYNKIYREIYRYYGVSQKDIDDKSKRYEDVIRALARI